LSVVNLDTATDWNVEDNAIWFGTINISAPGGVYSADYYTPPSLTETPAVGGDAQFFYPWEPGKRAVYGVLGVHTAFGQKGVDFVGVQTDASTMSAYAYAAESGTIYWVCSDGTQKGIKVQSASGNYLYLHFDPSISFTVNQTVQGGNPLGPLRYGTFDDTCGYASQTAQTYHLHFGFPGTRVGSCQLNGNDFVCGSLTISPLMYMPVNDGSGPLPPTIDGGTGDGGTVTSNNENIWTILLTSFKSVISGTIAVLLPAHETNPAITMVKSIGKVVIRIGYYTGSMLIGLGIFGPIAGAFITFEGIRLVVGLFFFVWDIVKSVFGLAK
jgi:hypothetical protein